MNIFYGRNFKLLLDDSDAVMQQVANNTKEQAMMGGFAKAINDAVIDSLDVHQNLATQVLNEDRVRKGLADIVYQLISKGLQSELRV
jgi:type I restriction enzyme R subunit